MMDLDSLYKANIGNSHEAALQAVWQDGYNQAKTDEKGDEEPPVQSEPETPVHTEPNPETP